MLFRKKSTILLYHRVAEVNDDPHLLAVGLYKFEKQLSYIKKHFTTISLREMSEQLKSKRLKKGSVAITFDDGYADNFINALPILEKLQIPATIFVTAGMIGKTEPFFWDKETKTEERGRSLTENELIELSKNQLIEIGAHTMTHPHLSSLKKEEQEIEILESKRKLESIIKKPILSFAYPFGTKSDFNYDTLKIVGENFGYACINNGEYITEEASMYELPRKLVRNYNLTEFIVYSL